MKICFIITGLGMGGAERQVCDLADELAKLGHQVMIISLVGESINQPNHPSVQIISLHMQKTPIGFIKTYARASSLIKKFKPNVVHSHMVHANLFARLLRLTTTIPRLICTAHNTNEGSATRMLAYRLTDPLCDLSTNVSQEAVDAFIHHKAAPAHRMIAVHNGINTESFRFNDAVRFKFRKELGISKETPLILAVGRLNQQKDYPNLLSAFSRLSESHINAQLVIIGAGEEDAVLKEIVRNKGLMERVHFLGLRHDVADWMSAADIYVMSSAWEGMPLVLLEAMSCKRVVVATDCGGVREVVGEAGLLVQPRQPLQLAEALTKAISMSREERDKIGRLARQRVIEHYSLEAATQRWLDIYQGKTC